MLLTRRTARESSGHPGDEPENNENFGRPMNENFGFKLSRLNREAELCRGSADDEPQRSIAIRSERSSVGQSSWREDGEGGVSCIYDDILQYTFIHVYAYRRVFEWSVGSPGND